MFVFEGYIVHEWERAGQGVQGRWFRRKMPQACSECNHRTADAGEKRRARAKMLGLTDAEIPKRDRRREVSKIPVPHTKYTHKIRALPDRGDRK